MSGLGVIHEQIVYTRGRVVNTPYLREICTYNVRGLSVQYKG